jgi:hypothetical protein
MRQAVASLDGDVANRRHERLIHAAAGMRRSAATDAQFIKSVQRDSRRGHMALKQMK